MALGGSHTYSQMLYSTVWRHFVSECEVSKISHTLEGTTHNSHTQIFLTHGGGGTNIFAHKGGRAVQTHFDDFDIKKSDGWQSEGNVS